jgi:hypothetical protein
LHLERPQRDRVVRGGSGEEGERSGLKTAILLQTHFVDRSIEAGYARLRREAPFEADVLVALDCRAGPERIPPGTRIPPGGFFLCNEASLLALPYPRKCAAEGSRPASADADLVALLFCARHPEYERVWAIEYDVHYEGDWGAFFDHFEESPADLLTTTIRRGGEAPPDPAEPPFHSPGFRAYPAAERLRAFLPIARLSRRGFRAIDAAYREGCAGQRDVTWPTILDADGLILEDIGGDGDWVRPENRHRFYVNNPNSASLRPGSFVAGPGFARVLARPNTLWHPVRRAGAEAWEVASRGGLAERLRDDANRVLVWRWLATRWNPLPAAQQPSRLEPAE